MTDLELVLAGLVGQVDQLIAEYRDAATSTGRRAEIWAYLIRLRSALVAVRQEGGV